MTKRMFVKIGDRVQTAPYPEGTTVTRESNGVTLYGGEVGTVVEARPDPWGDTDEDYAIVAITGRCGGTTRLAMSPRHLEDGPFGPWKVIA